MSKTLNIIGGGMAGSEAAWQAANLGVQVVIHEMRPKVATFAHRTGNLGEMVCSNSFRSDDDEQNAVGLLHWEMRQAGGLIIATADKHALLADLRAGNESDEGPCRAVLLASTPDELSTRRERACRVIEDGVPAVEPGQHFLGALAPEVLRIVQGEAVQTLILLQRRDCGRAPRKSLRSDGVVVARSRQIGIAR